MNDHLTQLAEEVRNEWNLIGTTVVRMARQMPLERLADDAIYLSLLKIEWPWSVGFVAKPEQGVTFIRIVELRAQFPEDRKIMSAVLLTMAFMLRQRDRQAAVVVLSPHHHGFSLQHKGADDVVVQELFPGESAN